MMSKALARRFNSYRSGYAELWHGLRVRPEFERTVQNTCERILANKPRYQEVEAKTGVPWWFVAIVHKMEGNLDFHTHLHNGNPLTARTYEVPRGRPLKGSPPFTWEESAEDALRYDGLVGVTGWTIELAAFYFEKFNGFGYQKLGVPSPYLWSYSHAYVRGKYVRDGVYDRNAVSKQSGAMVILQRLMDLDETIDIPEELSKFEQAADENETDEEAKEKDFGQSRTIFGVLLSAIGGVLYKIGEWFAERTGEILPLINTVADQAGSFAAPVVRLAGVVGVHLPWIGGVALVVGLLMAWNARVDAQRKGKIG